MIAPTLDPITIISLKRWELESLASEVGYEPEPDDTDADLQSIILQKQ